MQDGVARGLVMLLAVNDEVITHREALMAAMDPALEAGLTPDAEICLSDLSLELLLDGFCQSRRGNHRRGLSLFK